MNGISGFSFGSSRILGIAALLVVIGLPSSAADTTVRVDLDELRNSSVASMRETGDMVPGNYAPDSQISLADFYAKTAGSSSFGSWELKGAMQRQGRGIYGDNLRGRIGAETFTCSAFVLIDTQPDGTRVTSVDLMADSTPLSAFVPRGMEPVRQLFGPLPEGIGHVLLIGSRNAKNDSRVHFFYVNWTALGGVVANNASTLQGKLLSNMIAQMPLPYRNDMKVADFQMEDFNVRIRYYPLFYTAEMAHKVFGDRSRRDEMVMSIDASVDVPHKFLMLNTPTRYTLSLRNVPLRFFVHEKLKTDAAATSSPTSNTSHRAHPGHRSGTTIH